MKRHHVHCSRDILRNYLWSLVRGVVAYSKRETRKGKVSLEAWGNPVEFRHESHPTSTSDEISQDVLPKPQSDFFKNSILLEDTEFSISFIHSRKLRPSLHCQHLERDSRLNLAAPLRPPLCSRELKVRFIHRTS
jgi:hypothetical protein